MKTIALCLALLGLCAVSADGQSPLDRRVTLRARDVALRDALDRLAVLAGVRLSYSGDHLPLDRRISVARDSATLSDVLAELVRPYAVEPVAAGSDHIVLAPRRDARADTVIRSVPVLERVVVTGNVLAASERPLPFAIDVVRGRDIERRDERTLSKVFSGSVPGVWLWEQTPTAMLARYGSIRGASSFGLTFPKVYIDGIEVANPLLLTQISPELVDRIEVIRGPQGAALYGSDAISGVVNIVTRHEGTSPEGTNATVRSMVGNSATHYAAAAVPVQEHTVSIRTGSNLRSGGINAGFASSGQYIPQAYSRELRAVLDGRIIGASSTITMNARLLGKNASAPPNPLLAGLSDDSDDDSHGPQQLRMYSIGSTWTHLSQARWTYSVTAGLDGYSLANVANDQGPVPSVADTALLAAHGTATRATMRASAVTSVGSPDRVGASLTFGAEQAVLWDRTQREAWFDDDDNSGPDDAVFLVHGQSSNTGLLAQSTLSLRNVAFLSAGVRRERIDQSRGPSQLALLPMLGVAFVQDYGPASVKWRAAYGKGVRAPRSSMHVATHEPRRTIGNPNLAPESQSGFETGVDVRLGRLLGVQLTRFDQLVSGLIQSVTVAGPSSGPGSGASYESSWYQLQNVGEVTNRGWEAQASLVRGAVSVSGTATFVDSRVSRVAPSYTGEMRAGDRMLAVPARTLSATVSWVRRAYQLSGSISRASDWVNYDRLRIARALITDSLDADDLTGVQLRSFWSSYPGTTRLRASFSRDLWRDMALNVTGENLLGYQRGEPDTITIVPGRTISLGLRARF